LAHALGIHRHTLRKLLKENELNQQFSQLSDSDLDTLVHQFKIRYPNSGQRYLQGFLRKHDLCIQ
ncbi:hypothetical protein BDN72DRAFT_734199, partial [Pluteus cervinus]